MYSIEIKIDKISSRKDNETVGRLIILILIDAGKSELNMAEAALDSLLDNLKQLLLYHTHLINDAKDPIQKLENGLRLFKEFLRKADRNRRKDDDTLSMITNQIRDIVYEAEDTIDTLVSHAAKIKSRSRLFRAFVSPVNLQPIVTKVDEISRRVRDKDYRRIKFDFDRSEVISLSPAYRTI